MWIPTEEEKIGVVISSFRGAVSQGLVLEIGETVQILEKSEGWYRGFSTKRPAIKVSLPVLSSQLSPGFSLHSIHIPPVYLDKYGF
ncbi:hypothetical protein SKAU_G00421440 [Synaphobranchus kaupii]|uniref:SH3 domain-containing protein n=1 Tax=Synaphobranchus kaupii TaxID=118154 RepID=A0A9Q1E6Q1_SYNKA|nr:hypothetical protein SKAU_G00421440 [Synaphobranchus kaupii]